MSIPASPQNRRRLADALHDGAELTIGDIAELLQATTRTARRTIRALEEEGLPIRERREGRSKRFYLPERDRLTRIARSRQVEFTERELLALAVSAEAAFAALGATPLGSSVASAFQTILDRYEAYSFEPEEVPSKWYFASVGRSQMDPAIFATVAEAVSIDRSIVIRYTSREGKKSWNRKIDPYLIAEIDGSWQLVAYCHYSDLVMQFSIAAISEAVLDQPFADRHTDFDPELYFRDAFRSITGTDGHTVRFTVSADKAISFRRKMYHPTQQIEEDGPDGMVVSFEVAALDDVAAFLRSFGPGVVATEPAELVSRLGAEAAEVAEAYATTRMAEQ